ncbi:hypothetical protein RIR_jg22477.t1 [Rhizophagus irregularis DAOM 181602=DAOM 197198]|nr:hypothetical protein RIR_jg22477.t1 [Rhizophagus irregularis DAOM 181602=DAOM 197198]CAB4378604.1 unnamed protein product [Rhizophagus irregularis]
MQNVVQVMVIQLIHVFLKVKTKEFYFFSLKESSTIKESSRIQHKKNSINVKSRKIVKSLTCFNKINIWIWRFKMSEYHSNIGKIGEILGVFVSWLLINISHTKFFLGSSFEIFFYGF